MKELWLSFAVFLIISCALPKQKVFDPLVSMPKDFKYTKASNLPINNEQLKKESDWWKLFKDQELNKIFIAAMEKNPKIAQMKNRVHQQIALSAIEDSSLWPSIKANINSNHFKRSNLLFGLDKSITGSQFSNSLDMNFSISIWGEELKKSSAAKLRVMQKTAEFNSMKAQIAKEITILFFRLKEAKNLLKFSQKTSSLDKSYHQIVAGKFKVNLVTANDYYHSLEKKYQIETEIWRYQMAINNIEEEIRSLTFNSVPDLKKSKSKIELLKIPTINITTPSDLIKRSAELRKDLINIAVQDKELAAAIAAQFPKFSFTLSGGEASSELKAILKPENIVWSMIANLTIPIFDGGSRKAQVKLNELKKNEAILKYKETLWQILSIIEKSQSTKSLLSKALKSLKQQQNANDSAVEYTKKGFLKGIANYSDLYQLIERQYKIKSQIIKTKTELIINFINLCHAWGGWINDDKESLLL